MSRLGGAIFSSKVVDIVALLVRQAGGGLKIGHDHKEEPYDKTRNRKHEEEGALI